MPSNSRQFFRDRLLPDVANLIDAHRQLNPEGRGRRKLGHITRSGIVMLCASWELYIEQVLEESVRYLCENALTPDFLPDSVKGEIARSAKSDKHNFGVLKLCGDGWRQVYIDSAIQDATRLNTPKYGNISDFFKKWLGIVDIDQSWRHSREELNKFVTIRGEISHRGADACYITIAALKTYKSLIDDLTIDTDRLLGDYLYDISDTRHRPWRR